MKNGSLSRYTLPSALVIIAALASTCGGQSGQVTGGETNWLRQCVEDGDCSSRVCLCGVCTEPCESDNGCSAFSRGSCARVEDESLAAQCGKPQTTVSGMCLPSCDSGEECPDPQQCVSGHCVLLEVGPTDDTQRTDDTQTTDNAQRTDCPDGSDGSRPFVHSLEPDDTYLQDCDNPLAREYYLVSQQTSGTAYMFPGPSGSPSIVTAFSVEGHELQEILSELGYYSGEVNGLYDEATKQALFDFSGIENLEERWQEGAYIDPVVFEFMRRKRDAG